MILKSTEHSIAWLLSAFFSKYCKYTACSQRALDAHLGHRRLLQVTGHFRFSHVSPWPTELTLHPESHLGMWEVLFSLLSPFNLDLSGAVSAGWIGGFNNVNACLLEWAQVNLARRGHREIHVKALRISDFTDIIKDRFNSENLFFFFANHSTCVTTDVQLFFQGKLEREWLNCPTHSGVCLVCTASLRHQRALPGT